MIRLYNVSLSYLEKRDIRHSIMSGVTLALPSVHRVALLGDDFKAITEILSMLAGVRKPDHGRIDVGRMRLSPVINAGSGAGRTLVPQLTALENIRLAARTHGIEETTLIALVESACQFGEMLSTPVRNFDRPMQRKLEATLVAAIPFDCYFVDRLHEMENNLVWQLVHVAVLRGAGLIFSSRRPNQVEKIAEMGILVQDGWCELLDDVTVEIHSHAN